MRPPRLLHSSSFRFAAAFAGLFSVSVCVLFGIIYLTTVHSILEQAENEIRAELATLLGELTTEGAGEAAETIRQRVEGDLSGARLLLQDPTGRPIAGNLAPVEPENGWIDLPPPRDPVTGRRHSEHVVHGEGRILDDGSFLFVGRDTHPLRQLREIIVHGFLLCGLATILVALCMGAVASAGVMRRLRTISSTTGEIMRGDLSRRLAVGRRGDEFDELAGHVNDMLARIQTLVEDLRQITNDIAHDMRTPLTRLRHRLERITTPEGRGCPLTCPIGSEIEQAIEEIDGLLGTFSAMLRIAQIDAGTRRAGFRPVDLSALLAGLVETYAPVAEDEDHRMEREIAPGLVVDGDAELLTQLFVNLVENAIKHTPASSLIRVGLARRGGAVVATVGDDGPGVPPEMRDRVCRRFVRLERSRSTPGTGLGLSLVAAVAQLHGVEPVLLDNRPGLRVVLRFPDRTSPHAAAEHADAYTDL